MQHVSGEEMFIFQSLLPKLHFKRLGWFIERCQQDRALVAKKIEVRRGGPFSIEDAFGVSKDAPEVIFSLGISQGIFE